MIADGHDVGEHLGGVPGVGEPVPDGDSRELAEDLDGFLGGPAVFDAVEYAAEDPGGVLHRLLVAQLGFPRAEVGDVAALVVGGYLERGPGPGRGLLEDQRDVAARRPPPGPPLAV